MSVFFFHLLQCVLALGHKLSLGASFGLCLLLFFFFFVIARCSCLASYPSISFCIDFICVQFTVKNTYAYMCVYIYIYQMAKHLGNICKAIICLSTALVLINCKKWDCMSALLLLCDICSVTHLSLQYLYRTTSSWYRRPILPSLFWETSCQSVEVPKLWIKPMGI